MVMKELIRQILKEDSSVNALKKYVMTIFKRQVDSGIIPHIPYEDFRRKKITPPKVIAFVVLCFTLDS